MFGKKKKEFVFEAEEDVAGGQQVVDSRPKAPVVKKKSSPRSLLLLLLLVIAGGGGYFVMMNEPEPPPPPPAPVAQRQAIPIAQPAPAPAEPVAATAAPAAPAQNEPVAASALAPAAEAPTAGALSPAPAEPVATEAPAPAVAAAPSAPPAEKPTVKATAAVTEPVAKVAQSTAPAPKKPAAPGNFTLSTAAYADKGNIATAQRLARQLGFQPQLSTIRQDTTMTRLRYGIFRPEEAPARLLELKKVAPAAFSLRQGELVAVYAGSFAVQNKARAFADTLYQKQILVEEEVVKVKVSLQQVTFGSFAERGAADQAAAKARAAGLEVTVQARR